MRLHTLVIATLACIFPITSIATERHGRRLSVGLVVDSNNYEDGSTAKNNDGIEVSLQSAPFVEYGDLRFGISGLYNAQKTYLLGPGIGKSVGFGKYDASLFIYPSYIAIHGNNKEDVSGALNFKSTLDITYQLDAHYRIGIGVLHVSNAGYSYPNGGITEIELLLRYDF